MRTISIAKDFSVFPGGRVPEDGPNSGQEFRDKFLLPIFSANEQVVIDFDNVRGYGSSFLEEAFGGLLRKGIPLEKIRELLKFKSSRESVIKEVNRYIDEQAKRQ